MAKDHVVGMLERTKAVLIGGRDVYVGNDQSPDKNKNN